MARAGSLPANWGTPELDNMSDWDQPGNNLMVVDLANNLLEGNLPVEWAGMDSLLSLSLSNNHLTGSPPAFPT